MITATTDSGAVIKVDALINRGEWFGKTWLIGVQAGFDSWHAIVEADWEGDALDVLADSTRSAWIDSDDMCEVCEQQEKLMPEFRCYDDCSCSFAGNDGHRVNIEEVYIQRVSVDYFAKSDQTS